MAYIYFAGAETPQALADLLANGVQHVLFSYYEIQRGKSFDKVLAILERHRDAKIDVFVNAGARAAIGHRQNISRYLKAYQRFLIEHRIFLSAATELDVDGFDPGFTTQDTDEFREQLAVETGVPIVPVWHACRGTDAWTAYCQDSRYPRLALGPQKASQTLPRHLPSLTQTARQHGKVVHGFGHARVLSSFKDIRLDSLDTQSWKAGERFGIVYVFHQHQWKELSPARGQGKMARVAYRQYFQAIGVDFQKLLADDPAQLRKANIIAWLNFSKRLNVIFPTRPMKLLLPEDQEISIAENSQEISKGQKISTPRKLVAKKKTSESTPTSIPLTLVPSTPPPQPMSLELTVTEGGKVQERLTKGLMPSDLNFLQCSSCTIGALCPKYSEGSVCAFTELFRDVKTRNLDDVTTFLAALIEENTARYRMGRVIEQTLHGGIPSKDVTQLSQVLAEQAVGLGKLLKTTKSAKVRGDGEGILSKIFGGLHPQTALDVGGDGEEAGGSVPAGESPAPIDASTTEAEILTGQAGE